MHFSKNASVLAFLAGTAAAGPLNARAECKTITVQPGDGCAALAKRCNISATDFTKFNPDKNLCSTLVPDQKVCCSAGSLPDTTPKPQPDGTCASYEVKSGDFCAAIASSNGLTVAQIEGFNKQTYGWAGCSRLTVGINICLSTGNPPLPSPIENAVCGPQVPGTKKPTNGEDISSLNPCADAACCNIWGQCGTDKDFCDPERGPTGNPGTAPPGKNGCISNCQQS